MANTPQLGLVEQGPFKGFLITEVKRGWVVGHYPSNVTASCNVDEATTKLRWHWLEPRK